MDLEKHRSYYVFWCLQRKVTLSRLSNRSRDVTELSI